MIRVRQKQEGSKRHLLVEGALSGDSVEVLEECWLEAPQAPNIDLSGVTYVDDRGRELLSRMIQDGVELRATGVMTRAIIEELVEKTAMSRARDGQIR